MKKTFRTLLMTMACLASSLTAFAQTAEYKALLREALVATKALEMVSPGSTAYQGYVAMAKQAASDITDGMARQLTDAYMKERMLDINMENNLPYAMKHVSAEDLRQVVAFYTSPVGERVGEGIVKLQQPEVQSVITNWLQPALTDVLSGKKAKAMECHQSKEFMQQLKRVDSKAHVTDLLKNMLKAMEPQLLALPGGSMMLQTLSTLLIDNATNLFAEMYGMVYTTSDLKALADFYETPAGSKWIQVNREATENAGTDGEKIVQDFQQWIVEHAK